MNGMGSHKLRKSRDGETAADLLYELPGIKGERTRHIIASSENTDPDLLWYLSSDKSLAPDIAQNTNADEETVVKLSLDEDNAVAEAAAASLSRRCIESSRR